MGGGTLEDNSDQGQPGKEGMRAKRQLKRWTEDDSTILLLCLQFKCNQENIKLPWTEVAKLIPGPVTESSIIQHLAKLRTRRTAEEKWIPPPLKRSAAAGESRKTGTRKRAAAKNPKAKQNGAVEDSEDDFNYEFITDKKAKDTVTKSLSQSGRKQTKDTARKSRGQKRRNDSRNDSDPEFEPTSSRRRRSAPASKDTSAKDKKMKEGAMAKTDDSKDDNESGEECEKRLLESAGFSPVNEETSSKILRLKVPRISDLLNPADPASTNNSSVIDIPATTAEQSKIQDEPWLYQPPVPGRTTRYVRHDINPYVPHPSLSAGNMPMIASSWSNLSTQYLQDPLYSSVGADISSLTLPPITSTNHHWLHRLPNGFTNHDDNTGQGQQDPPDNSFSSSDFNADFGTPDFWA